MGILNSLFGIPEKPKDFDTPLPTPRYFLVDMNTGPVGAQAAEGKVLPLFKSEADLSEWATSMGVPKEFHTFEARTVGNLATLFGHVEKAGFEYVAVNPPPVNGTPLTIYGMREYFDSARKEANAFQSQGR